MTYSVGITGCPADNPTRPLTLTVDDTMSRPGDQQNAMMLNTQFLCLQPDGSQAYYTYDAERSDPSKNLRYLKKVAP